MSVQGRYLSQEAVERIAGLLLKTDMTINEIADRISLGRVSRWHCEVLLSSRFTLGVKKFVKFRFKVIPMMMRPF